MFIVIKNTASFAFYHGFEWTSACGVISLISELLMCGAGKALVTSKCVSYVEFGFELNN